MTECCAEVLKTTQLKIYNACVEVDTLKFRLIYSLILMTYQFVEGYSMPRS